MKSIFHVSHDQIEHEVPLIKAAQKSPQAFEAIYNKYYEQIFRFVYQRINNKDTAGDITHNIFLKALKNISKYKFKGLPYSSWLYRVAFNELNMEFRKEKKTKNH